MNGPRRSAGMRGDPRRPRPEAEISGALPPRHAAARMPVPVPRARHPKPPGADSAPKPEVLMGEVAAPRGLETGAGRDALRAFMLARRLAPTQWAKTAGVPMGEVLAYLTGRTRFLSQETAAKLARAAHVTPEELFEAGKSRGP
jgi:hypothetical protein